MNTRIFRQVSLARLSSPEQLDQILQVTSAKNWVGLLSVFMLLIVALIWGFEGSIASTSNGQGVIVRTGGVLNVVSRGSGMVVNLNVKVGDHLKANQIVATISQPELAEKMKALRETLGEGERQRERSLRI